MHDVDNDGLVTTYVTVPPDGGWGWAVVFASFYVQGMYGATMLSSGSLVEAVAEDFDVTMSIASIFSSFFGGMALCIVGCCIYIFPYGSSLLWGKSTGPVVSAVANRYGFRTATCIGTVIGCIGFGGAAASKDIIVLALSYGIIGGIGYGLVFIPSLIIVMFYFKKRRAVAQCIAVVGSSVGGAIAPPLIHMSVENWGWQTTVLVELVMLLSCGFVSLLYVPLKPVAVRMTPQELATAVGANASRSHVVKPRCDWSLAKSPAYLMFLINGCLSMLVMLVPFIYLPYRARLAGVDYVTVEMLVPTINIASTVGRIVCGVLTMRPRPIVNTVFSTSTAAAGIALALSSLSVSSALQIIVACVYGIYWAVLNSFRTLILLELVGLRRLTTAFGIMMLTQGLCSMIGPPFAGQIKEWTDNVDSIFWFAGAVMMLAAILVFPLSCVNRWEIRRGRDD